jgi:hypothetical protein
MNPAPSQNETQVTVGRWTGTYHVPRGFSALPDLQYRLDSIVAERLALACKSFLEPCFSNSDRSVWRIHDLTLNFSLDAGFSDAYSVARDWGRALAGEVLSIIQSGEVSDSVLRFPNRAAFLAQFLCDLAAGRAWGKWYYEEFSDLQVMSDRQAICAIFLRRDPPAAELLVQIASIGRLETVLQALNDSDAHLIFDLCFESPSAAPVLDNLQKWIGLVLELWNSAPLRAGSRTDNRFRDALRLLSRTLLHFPVGDGHSELKAAIDGLLELRRVLLEIRSPAFIDVLIKNLAAGELQSAIELATRAGALNSAGTLAFFAERIQADVCWAHQAVAVVLGESNKEQFLTSKTFSEGESFLSSFGGVFLLGPSLMALQLEELVRSAAESSEAQEKTAAILRHLIALKCFGHSRFADSSDDPALRFFSGFDGISYRKALEGLNVQQLNLTAAHGVLLQTLFDGDDFHAPVLCADIVSIPVGHSLFLLRDLARDEWLDLIPISAKDGDVSEVLLSTVRRISSLWKLPPAALYLSDSVSSQIEASALHQVLTSVGGLHRINYSTQEELAAQLGLTLQQIAFRLNSAQQHFPYFVLSEVGTDTETDANLECLSTLVSRAALRHFVRKLFGFESSSPDHIYQNFLSGLSEIRRKDQRVEVRLPASPLSLILRMAGLQEQKYAPSWLKGLDVWLLPPQE